MPSPLPAPVPDEPLEDAVIDERLHRAAVLYRPLRRCARVASISGWTLAGFGACSLAAAAASADVAGIVVSAAGTCAGIVELRGTRRLLRGDPGAPGFLALNQVALLLAIVAYASFHLAAAATGDVRAMVISPETEAQLSQMGGSMEGLSRDVEVLAARIVRMLYGSMIVTSVLFQGGLAAWYWGRRQAVETWVAQVPAQDRSFITELAQH